MSSSFARADVALSVKPISSFSVSGIMLPWASLCALLTGVVTFSSTLTWLLPWFFVAGYAVLLCATVKNIRVWRDPLNPLCLVVFVGGLRFFFSGLLFTAGAEPPDNVTFFFSLMKLSNSDWLWAHALAMIGVLAVVTGWLFLQPRAVVTRPLKFHLPDGVKWASIGAMSIGFVTLAAFFMMNASLGAVLSGSFRGTTIQQGTGKLFVLSYFLIVGSVLLCTYFLSKDSPRLAWIPVGVCILAYWPLGGRGRAMFPVACGLILMWYRRRENQGWRELPINPVYLLKAAVILAGLVLASYGGVVYRGESDGQEFSLVSFFAGLGDYLAEAVYIDFGALHSLAGAIVIGPAVLGALNLVRVFLWPLSTVMAIPGRSAGIFIVEELVGFQDGRKWALSPTIIGDAYLSVGLWGVVFVMALYGALLKLLYLKYRRGSVHSAFYVLTMLETVLMLVSSVDVWVQNLIFLSFIAVLMACGNTFFNLRGARAVRRAIPEGGSI